MYILCSESIVSKGILNSCHNTCLKALHKEKVVFKFVSALPPVRSFSSFHKWHIHNSKATRRLAESHKKPRCSGNMTASMHALLSSLLYISTFIFAFASGAKRAPPGACTKLKQQVCIQNATCVNHVCVCNAGLKGDGRFECVRADEHLCQVAADPRMRAFEGARARIFIPCKYRLTRFMTSFRNSNSRLRFCEFEAFSFNKIVKGLHFVGGLEIKVFIYDSGVQQSYQRDFLKFDIDSAGIHSEDSLLRWGTSSSSMLFHGVGVVCKFDTVEKFAILEIEECGVRFKFRAYNPRYPANQQRLMPGLSIQAPASASFSINEDLESIPSYALCGRTSEDGDNSTIFNHQKNRLGFNKRHQVMLYSILAQKIVQTLIDKTAELLPYASECTDALTLFEHCPYKASAIRACSGVVKNKRTVKCLRENLMQAFNKCLVNVCRGNLCSYDIRVDTGCHVPFTLQREKEEQGCPRS